MWFGVSEDVLHIVYCLYRISDIFLVTSAFFIVSERVVNSWNNLPSNTDFSSLCALKRYWFLSFVLYLCLYVLHWLLFIYCMQLRGAIRAFRALLLRFYSLLQMFSCDAMF